MLGKFFEALSGKLGETWLEIFRKPVFFFWAGGLLIWSLRGSNRQYLESGVTSLSLTSKMATLVAAFLVVQVSDSLARVIGLPLTRMLEGYWPRQIDWLRTLRVNRWNTIGRKSSDRFQDLQRKIAAGTANFRDHQDLALIDRTIKSLPGDPGERLPTRFGNLLRSAERRPLEKYGLDAVICWPRLWLLLPDGAKSELTQARASVDDCVNAWFWSLLFSVWLIWSWWAVIVSLIGLLLAYGWAVRAAEVFRDLVESAFDVYRVGLYKALRWPLPRNASEELLTGQALTQYLWRGSDDSSTVFVAPN